MKQLLLGAVLGAAGVVALAGIGGAIWLTSDGGTETRGETVYTEAAGVDARADVIAHSQIFKRKTEEVAPGVYLAVGYGLANVIVIDAPDGLILVDTLESMRAAQGLLPWVDELRQKTGKEITDLVYTHNHADHVFGAGIFLQGQETMPRIWAHEATEGRVHEIVNVLAPVTGRRAYRMFGVFLPDADFHHNGIGPRLLNDGKDGIFFLSPTDTVTDRVEVQMAGETVILQHAPGETADQLSMFLPDRKILLPADNYYHAFPNIYTVRGTPYRDPREWVASIDDMRGLKAEIMIPQHSLPVIGADKIEDRLRDYRDAIQYVYDETIRMINADMGPDEIAAAIKLPPHLANAPHLQEMYGRVEFAARAVFSGTLGWFSGDPAELRPVTGLQKSQLMADLAGGADALAKMAEDAFAAHPAWTLELATHLSALEHPQAQPLRIKALRKLAEDETASSVRNYFLTSAAEAEGFQLPGASFGTTPDSVINSIPIRNFLSILTVNLKSAEMLDRELAYGFDFTDDEPLTIRIRRGIAMVEDGLATDRIGSMRTSSAAFRGIAIKRLSPAKLLVSGDIELEGSVLDLQTFLGHFNPPI